MSKAEAYQNGSDPGVQGPRPLSEAGERARAQVYLDLWERHINYLAVHGSVTPAAKPHD